MATLYLTSGKIEKVEPKDGKSFHLEELYSMIDCSTIEILHLNGKFLIFDEEGKLKNNAVPNVGATALTHDCGLMPDDYIVGSALLCETKEFN